MGDPRSAEELLHNIGSEESEPPAHVYEPVPSVLQLPGTLAFGPRVPGLRTPAPWEFDEDKKWYVLQTKPAQEDRVIAHFRLRSVEAEMFAPRIEVTRRRGGWRVTCFEPLFPCYMFLRTCLTPVTWDKVRWAPGVRRVLGDGERPIWVPEDLIEAIRARMEPSGVIRVGSSLKAGSRVRIAEGPLAGLEGIFERPTSRHGRVRVLLRILGTCTAVEVDELSLEAL